LRGWAKAPLSRAAALRRERLRRLEVGLMSLYALNKICHMTQTDRMFREQMRTDPAAAIADFPLTDEERHAVMTADVAKLYQMGVHAFLLSRLPRFDSLGLTREEYIRRLRTLL